eukprot:contig_5326_g1187
MPCPMRWAFAAIATEAFMAEGRKANDKAIATWQRNDTIALADIQLSVTLHLLTLVVESGSAADAWETLRVLFEGDIASRRDDLEAELACMSLEDGDSMIKYSGRAVGIRDAQVTSGKHTNEHSLALNIMRACRAATKQ